MMTKHEDGKNDTGLPPEISDECAAVLRHQQDIAEAEGHLDRVVTALTEQRANIARLQESLPDMDALNRVFDDLLARKVTGEAIDDDLEAHQNKVAQAAAERERILPDLTMAERTLGALTRKQDELESRVRQLKGEKAALIKRFLLAEAEAECQRYVDAAQVVDAAYRRLMSLDLLLRRRGARHLRARTSLLIPRFDLKASNEQRGHHVLADALFAVDERYDREKGLLEMADECRALSETFGIKFEES